jgi:hypothetical protein
MSKRVVIESLDLRVEHSVVGFEREHVVGAGFVDLSGDGFLAAHGVECDDAAGQFQAPLSSGSAVILWLFSAVRNCPSTSRLPAAQALTRCTGLCPPPPLLRSFCH